MSGKLIMNALVMYDRQTGTLWSQFLGRGVEGPLSGTPLEMIPVVLTTWERWLAEYPDTVALDKSRGHYIGDTYSTYYTMEHAAGVLGQTIEDDRLPNKELVLGVGFDDGPKAYPFSRLADERVINDQVVDQPLVVYFDPSTDSAIAYERVIDGRELTFSLREEDEVGYLDRRGDRDALAALLGNGGQRRTGRNELAPYPLHLLVLVRLDGLLSGH